MSFRILMSELFTLCKYPHVKLPSLTLSARAYILAKLALHRSDRYQRAKKYWQHRQSGLPPAPELPLAKQPSAIANPKFVHLSTRLAPEIWLQLQHRAERSSLTGTFLLCAAYCEVLARWSKSSHFTITLLYFNRQFSLHQQEKDIVGNFSTTIMLEVDFSHQETFQARAKRLQRQFWRDVGHSQVSGVQVARDVIQQNGELPSVSVPVTFTSVTSAGTDNGRKAPNYTLNYSNLQVPQVFLDYQVMEEANKSVVLNWDFVEELFPGGLVNEAFNTYVRFLTCLAFDDKIWQEVSPQMLPAEQQQQAALNATQSPLSEAYLHTLMTEQASRRPNHPAVEGSITLTYQALYRRAGQLGHQLRKMGAEPNKLIAVIMEKGWEQVVAVYGILMAGAAYVPIDPELPQARCWLLIEECDIDVVLTQSWLLENLSWPENLQHICVDLIVEGSTDPLPLPMLQKRRDLAYVIFTSGSTGKPKGVMIDHCGAVNTVLDINRRFNILPEDKVLAVSSLSFDLSVYDIFGTLSAGATLVFPEASKSKEPSHWLDLVVTKKVTVWNSVPALMQLLVEYAVSQSLVPASLRLVMLSGDWIPLTLPRQIQSLIKGVQVISPGGATEASIWSILYPIKSVDSNWKSIPYGRPMQSQCFYVFNQKLQPCPTWVPGQLFIGGVGLARGYWKDKEKTDKSFILHPESGERLYRTGDMGRYLPSGEIELLGREDFQIKLQGFRIESSEIEAVLLQHPAVKAAVVTAVGGRQSPKKLVGYVVAENTDIAQSDLGIVLQNHSRQYLPQYMVPSVVMVLSIFPLTANGKIDQSALPAPEFSSSARQMESPKPRNRVEKQMAEIWVDVLGIDNPGIKDNFFELGGSSFTGMQLMARIQQTFGETLLLADLLDKPTIENLCKRLGSGDTKENNSVVLGIQTRGDRQPLFCVHPVGGNVLCYTDLARHLGTTQPVYGIQAKGLRTGQHTINSIEAMAKLYVEELRTIQPESPYALSGWSLGGIIAFEMAQQLIAADQEVALLALIDSYLPNTSMFAPTSNRLTEEELISTFAQDLGGIAGKAFSLAPEKLQSIEADKQFDYFIAQTQTLEILPPEINSRQLHQLFLVFKANTQAMFTYKPRAYPETAIVYCASADKMKMNSSLSWNQIIADINDISIPCNHYEIVRDPYIGEIAQHLSSRLQRIQPADFLNHTVKEPV